MSNLKVLDGAGLEKFLLARGAGSDADPFIQTNKNIFLDVAEGNVPGMSIVHKFGHNDLVGTSLVPVAHGGVYQTPATIQALELVSSDVNDTSAGTGARKVVIEGLGTGWAAQSETVIMNGITPVALANSYFRVFRAYVTESGTYATSAAGSHAGTLTLQGSGAGSVWAQIEVESGLGAGQSQVAMYTVPAGKTAYVLSKLITVETTKVVNVIMFKREHADDVTTPYTGCMRMVEQHTGVADTVAFSPSVPLGPFPEMTDIGFFAKVSTGTASVSIDFEILLVDD